MLGSSSSSKGGGNNNYDYSFKILLVGDSGVGKSSLLVTFISNFVHDLSPTIGVDFKIKMVTIGGKRLKLTIWDTVVYIFFLSKLTSLTVEFELGTFHAYASCFKFQQYLLPVAAGQERFGTLTSSYYRGAHGIILVYDVTRRETFTNLSEIWAKEVELNSTDPECIKILVGNKVDRDGERAVTREEGMALAQQRKCSFLECSAKTRANVHQCFKDLILKRTDYRGTIVIGERVDNNQETDFAAETSTQSTRKQWLLLPMKIRPRSTYVQNNAILCIEVPQQLTSLTVEFEPGTFHAYASCFKFQQYLLPVAAGQERFGTLTSSYYRGAHGIILVYDGTRRETFTNLSEIWAKEVELYSTNPECIKILVGNKVDRDGERAVTREEGMALAQQRKCLFLECSAKTRANVHQCFKDLILKRTDSRDTSLIGERVDSSQETDFAAETRVDFKIKMVTIGGKRLKLTIWDTVNFPYSRIRAGNISCICFLFQQYLLPVAAGQERFGTLTSSYYRGAHGIILDINFNAYDEQGNARLFFSDGERAVTREEGLALAQQRKCLFLECSAKTRANVHQCSKDLILKILEVPPLLEKGSTAVEKQILQQKPVHKAPENNGCCSQ
ncbi:hypothetical protein V6N11_070478 [Hibiscus sabdariffa]|uniref:Uncharacterized protein n=1 Tax=Hibiscus sabdariffa TaxID=183260 RepID=A0ABR2QF60_9ROSI